MHHLKKIIDFALELFADSKKSGIFLDCTISVSK
jgi:hypothetical protein